MIAWPNRITRRRPIRSDRYPPMNPLSMARTALARSANGSSAFASSSSIAQIAMKLHVAEPRRCRQASRRSRDAGRRRAGRPRRGASDDGRHARLWTLAGVETAAVRRAAPPRPDADQRPIRRVNSPGRVVVSSSTGSTGPGDSRRPAPPPSDPRSASTPALELGASSGSCAATCSTRGGVVVTPVPGVAQEITAERLRHLVLVALLLHPPDASPPFRRFLPARGRAEPPPRRDRRQAEEQRRQHRQGAVEEDGRNHLRVRPPSPTRIPSGRARQGRRRRGERDELQRA